MQPVNSIGNVANINFQPLASRSAAEPIATGPGSFKEVLLDSIRQVNAMQIQADQAVESLHSGANVNPAEVLTAVQQAEQALHTMIEIRDKLTSAFNEVRQMQV